MTVEAPRGIHNISIQKLWTSCRDCLIICLLQESSVFKQLLPGTIDSVAMSEGHFQVAHSAFSNNIISPFASIAKG